MNRRDDLVAEIRAVALNLGAAATAMEAIAVLMTEPEAEPARAERGTVDARVRDAAVAFGPGKEFTMDELIIAAGVSKGAAYRSVKKLLNRGVVEKAGTRTSPTGAGRPWQLYRYVKAAPDSSLRRKTMPWVGEALQAPAKAVAGTGNRKRQAKGEVAELLDKAAAAGAQVAKTANGHYKVLSNGKTITVVSGTPSDHRAVKNAKAALKRAGLT